MYGTDFWISSRGQLRISMKIKLRGHFSILFQLRISKARKSKFEKIDFLKILPICICKVEKNPKIFTPDFEVFHNWRWKYIKNWLLPLIFSEFHRAVFEKPIIFNFVRFLSWPRDEIQKSVPYIFSLFLSPLVEKKTAWRYLKWLLRNACRKFGSS